LVAEFVEFPISGDQQPLGSIDDPGQLAFDHAQLGARRGRPGLGLISWRRIVEIRRWRLGPPLAGAVAVVLPDPGDVLSRCPSDL